MVSTDRQFELDYQRVLGAVVRRNRTDKGWTRAELVEALQELPTPWRIDVPVPTLASYELGTRALSVLRLAQVELALGVPPGAIDTEVKSVMWPSANPNVLAVDLVRLSHSTRYDIVPAINWATALLASNPDQRVAELNAGALSELATLCLVDAENVMELLGEFRADRRYEQYGKRRTPQSRKGA
ncbi:MAG TPA: helix-turn-helix transcriptional regulator [Pseudonocardiaceae bacterium]|nr:helix-turn-helix transcriptional regulator [Pseudonocardiaceae bacterium]